MQNLFFRNRFVLGVLMVCVLMLGVQGVADAQMITVVSGNYQSQWSGQSLNIVFTISDITADPQDPTGTPPTISAPSGSIPIAVTGTGFTITNVKIGRKTAITSVFTLNRPIVFESTADPAVRATSAQNTAISTHNSLNTTLGTGKNTITVTVEVGTTPGTVTVNGTAYFNLYGMTRPEALTGQSTAVSDDGVLAVYDNHAPVIMDGTNDAFTFAPENAPVYYSVSGGNLYVGTGASRLKVAAGKPVSSVAPVYLEPSSKKSVRVTAGVPSTASRTIIFLYNDASKLQAGEPRVEIIGEQRRIGAQGGQLEEYLEVRAKDGAGQLLKGVAIRFNDGISTGMFAPVEGTEVYANGTFTNPLTDPMNAKTVTASSNSPTVAAGPVFVKTNTSGVAKIYYQLGDSDTSITVTASIEGASPSRDAEFSITGSEQDVRVANLEIVSGNPQRAEKGQPLAKPLVVIARSTAGYRIPNVVIQFRTSTGTLSREGSTQEPHEDGDGRTGDIVGTLDRGEIPAQTPNPRSGQQIYVRTGANGQASVNYNVGQLVVAREITAEVRHEPLDSDYSFAIDRVTFNINGGNTGSSGGGGGSGDTATGRGSLNISVPSTGSTRTVTVNASRGGTTVSGVSVLLNVNNGATLSRESGPTPLTSTLTLPATAGDYILRATTTHPDYTGASETITVTLPGTLSLRLIDSQVNGSQNVQVTARNAAGSLETTSVTVTLSGAGISRTVPVTGSQNVPIPLPTTSGTLTASATGYNPGSVILPARSTTPTTPTPTPTPTGTAGVANSIEIEGSRTIEGTVDTSTQLRARVLDANDRGVSDVRVTFRILAPGRGRLSQRGNGRAVQVNTDRNGYATAILTPLGGNLIVEAKAAGVSAPQTFIIDVGEAVEDTTGAARTYNVGDKIPISLEDTLTFRGSRTVSGTTYTCVGSGECVVSYGRLVKGEIRSAAVSTVQSKTYKVGEKIPLSLTDTLTFRGNRTVNGTTYTCVGSGECVVSYGTLVKGEIRVATKTTTSDTATPSREINPVVQVAAANRPPMVWVDGGGIYALVGASVQRFAPSVDNALNLTVGGGKVYWTEKTGESAGTINSADLDGSDVEELKAIQAVPMGIAVDTAARKLYWTNSRGRIQRADLDGSGIENVLQNLPGPKDIAVARGNVYWTQYDATAGAGSVGIANSTGRGTPKYISTGSDTPGSLVISGNKVYWTEMTGTSSGTINSANLNGNDAAQLASIRAVPIGIAVDAARSTLYWTNSRGRIQSANLDGSKIQNVVDGLGGPGDMVLSNSIKAPVATTTTTTTTTASNKYDVNGDGTVDSKDVDALLLVVLAELTDAKYDVNGDGAVDAKDIRAVNANLDAGAAGAPTLLGKQFSALEVSRLQAQIELLIATDDRSPAAIKTLIYLQQLIAMARPEKTQLFANYPNPFNPETWMPYELATDTNVRITIYNTQGVVIRTLQLGQQSAGYYTDRERAAYWDGKNALGEQVASGIYFYQLETDAMSLMRKMVILK